MSMFTSKLGTILTATALAGSLALGTIQPARADGAASTRNIILGAAAVMAIAIEANVASKHAKATTVAGYLPNGAVVYQDGHVQNPDGSTYYPGNYGEQIACSNNSCSISGGNGDPYTAYNPYNGGYYNGNYYNSGYNTGYYGSGFVRRNGR